MEEMVETIKPDCYDIVTYTTPWTPSKMAGRYGFGYHFLKKSGFNGKGCGKYKQGIQVPLDNEIYDHTYGLGFNSYRQPSIFPLNVNHIYGGHLKLVNPFLLDNHQKPTLDVFPEDEVLLDFLGVYEDLPTFHHK